MNKTPLLGMTMKELQDMCLQLSMPKFTAKQIAQWIYVKHAHEISEMTNISKANREMLDSSFCVGCSSPVETTRSKDGTIKFLFSTSDGKYVETVYIPEADRATLCVSCQVGCKMNCLFCQTGKQGWNGNLSVTDILNQVYSVDQMIEEEGLTPLSNIVYMGQGEPLDNWDNVLKSTQLLTADYGWAWSPRRITISTVGLKKNMRRLLEECECHIAVSLHTPIHEQRLSMMPAEKQFAIADIVEMLKEYDWSHQRHSIACPRTHKTPQWPLLPCESNQMAPRARRALIRSRNVIYGTFPRLHEQPWHNNNHTRFKRSGHMGGMRSVIH